MPADVERSGRRLMGEYQPIGEMLISQGKITPEQLDTALKGRNSTRRRIGEVLVTLGFVNESDVAACLAQQFGFDIVNPRKISAEPEALELLTGEVALSHRILPLRYSSDCIECAIADPLDFPTTDMISRLSGKRTVIHIAPASGLIASIRKAYGLKVPRSYTRSRSSMERVSPKPQEDRMAILDLLMATDSCAKEDVSTTRDTGARLVMTQTVVRRECDPS